MKENKILTISVAAYNLEKLIEQNLKSFVNSKYKEELEVLVIDDESTDDTAKIVEKYEKMYPNTIRLIKQKNGGPGSTVNNGIKNATGKYFKMVDGDDWVETEDINELIIKLRNIDTDMVITNYEIYSEKDKKIIDIVRANIKKDTELEFSEVCKQLYLQMHAIIFKTSLLQKNKIKLDNGFYTDMEYALYPLPYVKTVIYLDLNIYVYRIARAGQSVNIKSMQKNIKMHDEVLNNLISFYERNKSSMSKNLSEYIAKRIAKMAWTETSIMLSFKDNKNMKEDIKKFILELKKKSKEIYVSYKKINKAKILIYSKYTAINVMSKLKLLKTEKDD